MNSTRFSPLTEALQRLDREPMQAIPLRTYRELRCAENTLIFAAHGCNRKHSHRHTEKPWKTLSTIEPPNKQLILFEPINRSLPQILLDLVSNLWPLWGGRGIVNSRSEVWESSGPPSGDCPLAAAGKCSSKKALKSSRICRCC